MKKPVVIEPSMIAANWACMGDEAKRCFDAGVEMLHLDVMDGLFVPNLTMGPDLVKAIRKAVPKMILDVHLMVYNPDAFIEPFIESGADMLTFHFEATEEIEHTIDYIRKCGKKPGLAIKPETSENFLLKYMDKVDTLLIMTVDPGFGGQAFMPEMLEKVKFLRDTANKLGISVDIQVDGGINYETAKDSISAGANRLVTGTHLFKQPDLKDAYSKYSNIKGLVS